MSAPEGKATMFYTKNEKLRYFADRLNALWGELARQGKKLLPCEVPEPTVQVWEVIDGRRRTLVYTFLDLEKGKYEVYAALATTESASLTKAAAEWIRLNDMQVTQGNRRAKNELF